MSLQGAIYNIYIGQIHTLQPASQLERALAHRRTREVVHQGRPERLPANLEVIESWAGQVEQRRRERVGDDLQGLGQRGPDARQQVGADCLHDLEDQAQQVVALQQGGRVEDAAGNVGEIDAGEAVDLASVAADAVHDIVSYGS